MKFYTHIAGAILFFLILAHLLHIQYILIGIFFTSWISVFPDVLDKLIGNHRGLGHSMIWIVPFSIVGFFNFTIAAAMMIGFLSHLLLDIFTVHGSPLLYPIKKTKFVALSKRRRIRTGTNQDKAVFIFLLFLMMPFLLFTTNAGQLISEKTLDPVVAAPGETPTQNTSNNSSSIKNNINIYLTVENSVNKNISIQKADESPTNILVNDI
jgi:inner membrane protein